MASIADIRSIINAKDGTTEGDAVELSEGVVGHYNYHGRLCAIEFKNGILPIICNGGKRKKGWGGDMKKDCIARKIARTRAAKALAEYRKTKASLWWEEYHKASQWDKRMEIEKSEITYCMA